MLKVLVIDPHVLFRDGIKNILAQEQDIHIISEASSIAEAVRVTALRDIDIALLNSDTHDIDGFQGIRLLHAQKPEMHIVLISGGEPPEQLIRALQYGARGIIQKGQPRTALLAVLRAIQRGEAAIPRALVNYLLEEFLRLAPSGCIDDAGILTQREREVLRQLGLGRSNRQIAEHLEIAENTVKVHVHNILDKLNLRNRRQAARYARCQSKSTGSLVNALLRMGEYQHN